MTGTNETLANEIFERLAIVHVAVVILVLLFLVAAPNYATID